ncbi:MAG: hypothetical protein ABH821_05935, partial [archaeon]
FFKDERAQSEWSALYLIIIFVIVVLVLLTVIKPLFARSGEIASEQPIARPAQPVTTGSS